MTISEDGVAKGPRDVELEQALLGALFVHNDLIDIVAADLEAVHISEPLHQRIFDTILVLHAEGQVNVEIVATIMKRDEGLRQLDGVNYLLGLALSAPIKPAVKEMARLLRDMANKRELHDLGESLVFNVWTDTPTDTLAQEATERLLLLGRDKAKPVVSAYELGMESLREVERMANGEHPPMVRTGFNSIDEEIGGMRGGDFIVIPGKSGMGKSALMGGIARNTAFAGVPTIVFSLEMMRRQWVERMVCDIDFDTAVKPMWYSRVRNGRLSENEFGRFAEATQRLWELPFEIRDEDDLTIHQIAAIARAFKAKHKGKIGIVMIDYIQIVDPGDVRHNTREQAVNAIARGCKSLAKLLDWPVVAGSQMNEGAENRSASEKRPQATDVRESKGIMNEADLMLSPYREAFYVENRKPIGAVPNGSEWNAWKNEMDPVRHKMELLMLKNRHGRRHDFELYCDMGASAIRDTQPWQQRTTDQKTEDENAQGLLV